MVLATLEPPPKQLGVTHWSSRLLAASWASLTSRSRTIWREQGLQPWRTQSFKFSTDPQLEAKVRDVVGLYLNPPDKAVVLCVDEKPQMQALERTAPILPMRPGILPKSAPTTTSGTAPPRCSPHWRSPPARSPAPATPSTARGIPDVPQAGREDLPAGASCTSSCDNYATHKHPNVTGLAGQAPPDHAALHPDLRVVAEHGRDLLRHHHPAGHPPRHLHLVADLIAAIEAFIDGWNERCQPFTWTKTADEILTKAARSKNIVHATLGTRRNRPRTTARPDSPALLSAATPRPPPAPQ